MKATQTASQIHLSPGAKLSPFVPACPRVVQETPLPVRPATYLLQRAVYFTCEGSETQRIGV